MTPMKQQPAQKPAIAPSDSTPCRDRAKRPYRTPAVVAWGTVEELTAGNAVMNADFPGGYSAN